MKNKRFFKSNSLFTFILFAFLLLPETTSAQRKYAVYFAQSRSYADIVFNFCESTRNADLVVNVRNYGNNDIDVCFVDRPSSSSLDYRITTSLGRADKKIFITDRIAYADVKIKISDSASADIRLGILDEPRYSTKKIYIEDFDHRQLTTEQKVAFLYTIGLLKK